MRPQFHFTADGWINDPHAITYAAGAYHLFFQYVPGSTSWNLACSWGHARGHDLFSLAELAPVLTPGDGDDGIWSGSFMMRPDGGAQLLYTSVSRERPGAARVRVATPVDPYWNEWRKGPIVIEAPEDRTVATFRDPAVIRDGDRWRMVVGAGLVSGDAAALGYSSLDGMTWSTDGLVASRPTSSTDPVWSGSMWECPQVVRVGDDHVLIVSVWDNDTLYDVVYAVGDFRDGEFQATRWGRVSHGLSPYAATTFADQSGEPCIMFWLRGVAGAGWTGAHSIPYRMRVVDGHLRLSPHPDIESYHSPETALTTAIDIHWSEEAEGVVEISQRGASIVSVRRDDHELHLDIAGEEQHRVPWQGDVRIIVDGPVLETCSDAGVFAAALAPSEGPYDVAASGVTVRRLERQARR